ncbi:MAG: hypothetical protein ACO3YZ_03555 [Candidatus Nanopelagicaceae bacterium]
MKTTKYERKVQLRIFILMLMGFTEDEAKKRSETFRNEGADAKFTVAELADAGVFPHTGTLAKLVHQGKLEGKDPDRVIGTDPANVRVETWETASPSRVVLGTTIIPGLKPELLANLPPRMRHWDHFDLMRWVLYATEPQERELNLLASLTHWEPSASDLEAALTLLIEKAVALRIKVPQPSLSPWVKNLQKLLQSFHESIPLFKSGDPEADLLRYAGLRSSDGEYIFQPSLQAFLPRVWSGSITEEELLDHILALSQLLGRSGTDLLQQIGLNPDQAQSKLIALDSGELLS